MQAPKRIHAIINPAAGGDEPILNAMNSVFQAHQVRWDVSITQQLGDGAHFAAQAAEAGVDLVLAYGGDGTVMDVANGLRDTGQALAVLRGGTANGVATELGVPGKLETALEGICEGRGSVKAVDMGQAGERHFLLRADVGISTALDAVADRENKDRYGVLAYLGGALHAFTEPNRFRFSLVIDGEQVETEGAGCIVANMGNVGTPNFSLAQDIRYDDGLLNVFVAEANLKTALSIAGTILNLTDFEKAFQHWRGRDIEIIAEPGHPVCLDGEPVQDTPVQIRVLPGSLRLFIPQE